MCSRPTNPQGSVGLLFRARGEMADTLDLGSSAARCEGSSPSAPTICARGAARWPD